MGENTKPQAGFHSLSDQPSEWQWSTAWTEIMKLASDRARQ